MRAYQIPGFVGNDELRTLFSWAQGLPEGVNMIEVGSCFGRSSAAWAEGAPSCNIHCFDQWPDHRMPGDGIFNIPEEIRREHNIPDAWSCVNSVAFFKENLKWARNVHAHQVNDASQVVWGQPVHAIWIDAEHRNPSDREYIDRFLPHLVDGGWIGGHDYSPEFPDVMANADYLSIKLNSPVEHGNSTTWRVRK